MKTNVWNEERRHAALKSGSISVNGYIRLGEVLEGTYEVVAMRSINEEMENCNMVFFEKKNHILMQNPHSLLQCPLQKLIPGQKVKVRITFIAYNGMSNAELVS